MSKSMFLFPFAFKCNKDLVIFHVCLFTKIFFKYHIYKMSKVEISQKNMKLAQKSLKNLYIQYFGEDSVEDIERIFSKDELVLKYAKNIKFWRDHLPNTTPDMTGFSIAKHAICTNAIQNLFEKVKEYDIDDEVENVLNFLERRQKK